VLRIWRKIASFVVCMAAQSYWNGKLVWVTGASSGIGEAFAHEFARKGAKVLLSSRSAEKLNALLHALPGEGHRVLPLDVSDPVGLDEALQAHADAIRAVDILVNNAGLSQRALTWEATRASERMIMETNFFGATALTKAVLPAMMERNEGMIISMSSPAGVFGFPLRSSYAASKHALHGYFDSLRAELKGRNIHIMLALPGRVRTNMSFNAVMGDGSKQGTMDKRLSKGLAPDVCAKRIVRAAECKQAELYLGPEQALIYVKRFIPSLFRRIVTNFKPD
jgi:dehydrogenase/reductase SDR family protein 7B